MKQYEEAFKGVIDKVKREKRYRVFTAIRYLNFPIAYSERLKKNVVVWCSNNYLGMSQHPVVVKALCDAANELGGGSGGTRNISGTSEKIEELENELASLHSKEAALVFTSGYNANQATLAAIGKIMPDCVIFSDEDNHASIIHGIKDSKLEKNIFRHNDVNHLIELIKRYPLEKSKMIVCESIYSMSGTIVPIKEIIAVAQQYNAMIFVDEVHAVGMYGKQGEGIIGEDISMNVDIIQGTLSKGFGIIGGYIAANRVIIDAIRSIAPGFIFTTSLPPCIAAAATASIRYLRNSNKERQKQQEVAKNLKNKLSAVGIKYIKNETHIIPLVVGDPEISRQICEDLLQEFNIYAQNINYPTVPRGTERIRITPTPMHTGKMSIELVAALEILWKRYGLLAEQRDLNVIETALVAV